MKHERLLEIAAERELCGLCTEGSDETCFSCTKAKGVPYAELIEYFAAVNAALRRAPLPDSKALTVEELRGMVGAWVWVIVQYEHGKCDGWAFVATPAYIGFLNQMISIDFCDRKFVAYRHLRSKEKHHEV